MSEYKSYRRQRSSGAYRDYTIDGNTVRRTREARPANRADEIRQKRADEIRRQRADARRQEKLRMRRQEELQSRQRKTQQTRSQTEVQASVRRRRSETLNLESGRETVSRQRGQNGIRRKITGMDLKYTLFLCIAVLAALASCVVYLTAQSIVTQKNEEVIALKSELNLLIETNSQTKERINDSIDLEYVREYAVDVMGMVYPTESQIVKYHSDDEDYIKQYQDIPQIGQ